MMLQSSILLSVAAIFGGVLVVTGLCGGLLARSRGPGARFRSAVVGVVGLAVSLFAIRAIAAEDVLDSAEMALLERIPETDRTRKIAAAARVGSVPDDDHDATLAALLPRVKSDDEARQEFVAILELMGPDDPRTADYRRKRAAQLF